MITARPQKDLKNAKEYFREHLRRGDYHSQGQTIEGQWYGKGVERLALEAGHNPASGFGPGQIVTEDAFIRLCDNQHPLTGKKLTVRSRKERRVFYDFTCSAPKSVSVMAVTLGDARILAAHDRACQAALVEMERAAATRIRKGRRREKRTTGEIVAATFRHDASRALDPQLHTHMVVFNATWDPVEQRWKALESEDMFDQTKFYTEVYRNALAADLLQMGYQLRSAPNGFEIDGVSESILQRFSKRSQAITAAAAKLAAKLGKPVGNDALAAIAHATRQRKQKDLSTAELVALQREQLTTAELTGLQSLLPGGPQVRRELPPGITPGEAVAHACDHLFERRSVVAEHEILAQALAFTRGRLSLEAVRASLKQRPGLIHVGGSVTTQQALRDEQRMIALVNQGLGRCRPFHPQFVPATTLSAEQRQVVTGVLSSPDAVLGLRGGAGTGKTVTLKEIVRGITAAGLPVAALAPSAAAVEVLRQEGFANAQTVQALLVNEAAQQQLQNRVLLVDEAGLLSNTQMLGLLELAARQRCRLLLSGDLRQHSSIEAGDALRLLEQHSALRTVELHTIRRQTNAEYRTAVAEIAAGQAARAFVRLERMGAIREVSQSGRYQQLAADYLDSLRDGKSALIITPTRRESEITTEQLRYGLQQEGRLQTAETNVVAHLPLQWTEAQKRDLRNYARGHVLLFHRPTRDFRAGEWGEVVEMTASELTVRKANGRTVSVTKKQSCSFDVARRQVLAVAAGEQLLMQANRRDAQLLNGQIVTVKKVERDGRITLDDGRTIPADFRTFNYGYCLTSPKSQGKTVDHVYVAVDGESGKAVNVKQFYVSASRGREQIRIYTDDLDWLRDQVLKSGTRQAALELVEETAARQQAAERVRPAAPRAVERTGVTA